MGTDWALDFKYQVSLSFRSTISTLRFSWKIKYFGEPNIFSSLDILHDFSISGFYNQVLIHFWANFKFFDFPELNFFDLLWLLVDMLLKEGKSESSLVVPHTLKML